MRSNISQHFLTPVVKSFLFILTEQRTTVQGQVYFLHTQTGVSTWHDPRIPRYDFTGNKWDLRTSRCCCRKECDSMRQQHCACVSAGTWPAWAARSSALYLSAGRSAAPSPAASTLSTTTIEPHSSQTHAYTTSSGMCKAEQPNATKFRSRTLLINQPLDFLKVQFPTYSYFILPSIVLILLLLFDVYSF